MVSVKPCNQCGCANATSISVSADSCNAFCVAIGGTNSDIGYSIIQTNDGGYAIAGYTNSFGQGGQDVYVVKLDGSGNVQWTKTIGGANNDYGQSIIQTTDGGFAIAGYTASFGAGSYDVYVVKLDANGNLQWTRTIGGANYDAGQAIIQTTDGGYAIVGRTQSFGADGADVYVVKLDANGNLQWTKAIGGASNDLGYSIIQTNDGGYAIAGYTNSFGAGFYDVYVVKLNAQGNLQWTKTIGGSSIRDLGFSIIQTNDGGYIITGYTTSFGAGGYDVYVIKLDASGTLQWTKAIGGVNDDGGNSIIQTNDGGYVIAGYTNSFGAGGDVYVIKLDASGTLQWTKTIGGANNDRGNSIIQTNDGGYAIAGYTSSFGAGSNDIYVIKLDAQGNLVNCPGGCQIGSGGTVSSGGTTSSGGTVSSGGTTSSGGSTSSGGTLTNICP